MSLVQWERKNGVAFAVMTGGENRQNLPFAQAMNAMLDEVVADPEVKSLVLASEEPKFWSLGVDLEWMMARFQEGDLDSIRGFMYGMDDVFKKLLLLPVPAIAAIGGHAFGNGAILACACDFRFMKADRGYFCFPEVDLGIPFLPGMIAFVKKAFPYYKYNEMKLTGRKVAAPELAEHHILEQACADEETLRQTALDFAAGFDKKRGIFGEHKLRLHRHIIEVMDTDDPPIIEKLDLMVQG